MTVLYNMCVHMFSSTIGVGTYIYNLYIGIALTCRLVLYFLLDLGFYFAYLIGYLGSSFFTSSCVVTVSTSSCVPPCVPLVFKANFSIVVACLVIAYLE